MVSYKIGRPSQNIVSVGIYDGADGWIESIYSTNGTITIFDRTVLVLRDSAGYAIMFLPKSKTTIMDESESEFSHLLKEE